GRSWAARSASSQNCSPRMLMPIPVFPRITAPGIQPPLGVLSKMLPSLSMIAIWVVSLMMPLVACAIMIGLTVEAALVTLAVQYFHSLTFESNGRGLPAWNEVDARLGSISFARSLA